MAGDAGAAMSREQWYELLLTRLQKPVEAAALETVDDMIIAGALTVGPMRMWTVVHDDPQARQRYEFEDVAAPTPELACRKGARLAILVDPYATMSEQPGGPLSMGARELIADGLAPLVATKYTTATETTKNEEAAPDGEAGQ